MTTQHIDEQNSVQDTSQQRQAVLIVDDEMYQLNFLDRILRSDFIVYRAQDTVEARHILAERLVQVIVCDRYMPDEDGVSFLRGIQAIYPDVHSILLSGEEDGDVLDRAISDGYIFKVLSKPLEPQAILEAVHAAVEQCERLDWLERSVGAGSGESVRECEPGAGGGWAGQIVYSAARSAMTLFFEALLLCYGFLAAFAVFGSIFVLFMYFFQGPTS
ncbi:MAG: response regulator [Verrucomicrobia bacterium]|nr:response regulator [Verrucomicrobiota bacterium]